MKWLSWLLCVFSFVVAITLILPKGPFGYEVNWHFNCLLCAFLVTTLYKSSKAVRVLKEAIDKANDRQQEINDRDRKIIKIKDEATEKKQISDNDHSWEITELEVEIKRANWCIQKYKDTVTDKNAEIVQLRRLLRSSIARANVLAKELEKEKAKRGKEPSVTGTEKRAFETEERKFQDALKTPLSKLFRPRRVTLKSKSWAFKRRQRRAPLKNLRTLPKSSSKINQRWRRTLQVCGQARPIWSLSSPMPSRATTEKNQLWRVKL